MFKPQMGTAHLRRDTVLTLTGPDAGKFLQGQTSADFSAPVERAIIPGAFCDIKGRVIADFLALVVTPETICLRLSEDLADPLMAHLEKFLMFAKADLRRSGDVIVGLLGEAAHRAWQLEVPEDAGQQATALEQGYALPRGPGQTELILTKAQQPPESDLAMDDWYAARMMAGEARVIAATQGKYLPQDLNYDLNGWINFKKGCYTGQEIIARLHWRGQPKRRLYLAWLDGALPTEQTPQPGTPLTSGAETRSKGSIVNVATRPEGYLLAIETTVDGLEQALTLEGIDQPLTVL